MNYQGDIFLGDTIDIKFTTVNTSGVPTTLTGSPVVSAYVGNSTTEITAGVTLTVDFDARVGMHNVRVVASSGNGFAATSNVNLVVTVGTVGGSSVVGYVVGSFSIQNRPIWNTLTSALTTVGSIGKLIVDNLNVAISSRSTYVGDDTPGTITLLSRINSALTITSGKVDVNDKTGFSLTSAYDAAKTAAQVGSAMTLTSGERTAIADAILTRADGVETGITLRQALRYVLAFCAGKSSGAGTNTIIFRAPDGSTARVTLTVNTTTGERSASILNG